MACNGGCNQDPCGCVEPTTTPTTKCDLYKPGDENVWVERACQPGNTAPGICLLDTWSKEQVIYSIQRDDVARADLLRVTSDPELRQLAVDVPRLPTAELADMQQTVGNRNYEVASNPFYTIFRGQPPFAQ